MAPQRSSGLSPPPRRGSHAAMLVVAMVGSFAVYACSLIVETRDQQCQHDADCTAVSRGAAAMCDPSTHVCVAVSTGAGTTSATSSSSSSASSSGNVCDVDGGIAGGGCYGCAPRTTDPNVDRELLNACTNGCIPFDDGRVAGKLLANGMLPPLPTPGPDGGF